MGKEMSFLRKLLCPTMLSPLLFWADLCHLLLCGGCQPEEPATGFKEVINSDSVVLAAFGGEANLYCNFSLSMEVLQVTWQKINGSFFQNIATYSSIYGLRLIGPYQKKVRFTGGTSKASAITLQNLTFDDESYYRCIFNVFRHGSFSKDILLSIQTISELTVELDSHLPTEGLLAAVCSATGKPAPNITWLDDRGLDVSPQIHYIQNRNGTVTVASRLTFSANHLHALCCLLEHPQGRQIKVFPLEPKGEEGVQKIIIIMPVVISVLLTIMMICCVVRLIKRRRKNQKSCSAPRTPAKETGLHQDLGEKASGSLHTPPDQHAVHQNEEQTRSTSLHKKWKRNWRKQKNCRCLFSEEAEKLNSNSPAGFESGCAGLPMKELGCTPINEDREAKAAEGVQGTPHHTCPAEEGETSAVSTRGPVAGGEPQLRTQRKGQLAQASPSDVPGDPKPWAFGKPIQMSPPVELPPVLNCQVF